MKHEVKEAIGELGREEPLESPIAKLGQVPSSEEGDFDPREYLNSGLDLDHYLEPLGFSRHDDVLVLRCVVVRVKLHRFVEWNVAQAVHNRALWLGEYSRSC